MRLAPEAAAESLSWRKGTVAVEDWEQIMKYGSQSSVWSQRQGEIEVAEDLEVSHSSGVALKIVKAEEHTSIAVRRNWEDACCVEAEHLHEKALTGRCVPC